MNANDLLKNLTAPELNNPNFTNSFSQLISDINTNFKILAGAPFGVGGQGDSMVSYMEYLFVKSSGVTLLTDIGYEVFKVLFPKINWTNVGVNVRDYEVIKGIINTTYKPINNIGVLSMFDDKIYTYTSPDGNLCEWAWCGTELIDGTHQSVLPISLYQFYDQRTSGLSNVNNTDFEDMTASVFATLDESGNVIYKSLSIYPKLYFDQSNKYWAWMINNEKTGINATGPKGSPGSAGSALVYDASREIYFYEGEEKNEQYMIDNGILKGGSIRFRVVNNEVPEEGDPIRSELYLDAYSIVGDEGAWSEGPQLYKTLDNWLIKNYFDEIRARVVETPSPQTLRALGLPIFNNYYIDESESSGIGYPTVGATIEGYHSIEPRRDKIGDNESNKLHIQPIEAADLYNKGSYPNANTTIPNCDIQILDYVNIYVNKANDPIFANIKSDSFSILNSAQTNKHTKQTIDGIEVRDNNIKSNLSSSNLLVQLVNGYEDNIIQSNLTFNGLFVKSGLKSSMYRADRIQMMNEDNTSLPSTYNKISSNLLYIGTQRVDEESFVPGNTSRGFYVTGNTGEETDEKEYRSVLYKNYRVAIQMGGGRTRYIDIKKSNTSTADGIEIKDNTNGNNVYANIKNNSFSILDSALLDEYTKQTIGGIEVQSTYENSKYKSNLSGGGLLVQLVNGYEGDVIQSYLSRNGLIITNGLNKAYHYANSIKVENETSTNTSTADSNVIDDGTHTNTSTASSIVIKEKVGTSSAEINPYGGMLVPIGGVIMWPWRVIDIPKGFIPCGDIDDIETFHNNKVAPYCEKLEDIDDQPTYTTSLQYLVSQNPPYTADNINEKYPTIIIRPSGDATGSGRYIFFNKLWIPNFPRPSYPVSGKVDSIVIGHEGGFGAAAFDGTANNVAQIDPIYDKFFYIMRAF